MKSKLALAIEKTPVWKDAFRSSSVKVGFGLHLTRAMAEYLSAVADDVAWDRSKYGSAAVSPDNFLATASALIKRGLIVQKPDNVRYANRMRNDEMLWQWSSFELTAAGDLVVELLKLAGLFVEADAAIEKKHRRGA